MEVYNHMQYPVDSGWLVVLYGHGSIIVVPKYLLHHVPNPGFKTHESSSESTVLCASKNRCDVCLFSPYISLVYIHIRAIVKMLVCLFIPFDEEGRTFLLTVDISHLLGPRKKVFVHRTGHRPSLATCWLEFCPVVHQLPRCLVHNNWKTIFPCRSCLCAHWSKQLWSIQPYASSNFTAGTRVRLVRSDSTHYLPVQFLLSFKLSRICLK